MKKFFVCIALVVSFVVPSHAQDNPNEGSNVSTEWTSGPGIKKHIATIVFAGLAGGVLGLSTLPFYGRPQDHLYNIALGVSGGIIVGTTYVVYQAATNPKDFYADPQSPATSYFELEEKTNGRFSQRPSPRALSFAFSF